MPSAVSSHRSNSCATCKSKGRTESFASKRNHRVNLRRPPRRYPARQQRDEHPRIFIRIDVRHELEGQGLSETAVRRSIELSAGKYCPVNAMLAAGPAEIHHAYRIRGTDAEPWEAEGEVIVTGPGWPIAVASAEEMALEGLGEADLEARATEA